MTLTLILYFVSLGLLTVLTVANRKKFGEAIKGPDGRWDLQDVVKLIWLILFPVGFLSGLYLGLVVQEAIWYSLDMIFLILIVDDGRKSYIAYLEKKGKKDDKNSAPDIDDMPDELS